MRLPEVVAEDAIARAILSDSLDRHAEARLRVTGECMRPTFEPGDQVTLANSTRRPPRLGDVVLARGPRGLRLHRLVWGPPLARRRWRTMADTAAVPDPWWTDPEDVVGVVMARNERPVRSAPLRALLSLARALLS